MIAYVGRFMLLKVSPMITKGMAYSYLNRLRLRIDGGWVVMPNPKLAERILSMVGYDDKCPTVAATPGVKRPWDDENMRDAEEPSTFRSAVGALMHYSSDVEVIAFAVKELAREMHRPTVRGWMSLTRLGRYLHDKVNWVIEKKVDQQGIHEHNLVVQCDSDCQGDVDGRSTSGLRLVVNGYVLGHSAVTQPGLPALSSGEAELRSMTRAVCEGMYVQQVLAEAGLPGKMCLHGDATAALQNAMKLSGGRMRHLKSAQSFIKQVVKDKLVTLVKIGTDENTSDLLTKHVPAEVLKRLIDATGYRMKLESECVEPVKLERVNRIDQLESADVLVKTHEETRANRVAAQAVDLRGSV